MMKKIELQHRVTYQDLMFHFDIPESTAKNYCTKVRKFHGIHPRGFITLQDVEDFRKRNAYENKPAPNN